jgi:hypothetical protein
LNNGSFLFKKRLVSVFAANAAKREQKREQIERSQLLLRCFEHPLERLRTSWRSLCAASGGLSERHQAERHYDKIAAVKRLIGSGGASRIIK